MGSSGERARGMSRKERLGTIESVGARRHWKCRMDHLEQQMLPHYHLTSAAEYGVAQGVCGAVVWEHVRQAFELARFSSPWPPWRLSSVGK